ncbi:glycoside hydrolase family 30 protein [Christiangramia echinicola]|uniref:Glucosylceramidase n=1 Tax=Christiangramia echinicola TaxID=279359 RepID=A0A1H1MK80_9FLAO|nr:glycoside hydrolase family 30 beta sandwich domain-containing protein [Christiangramia echinicola]SDR87193.1 glucosylceramidase [Christiangramia echinicola]
MKALFLSILLFAFTTNCSNDEGGGTENPENPVEPGNPTVQNEVNFYLTKGDQSVKLEKQSTILAFGTQVNNYTNIEVDASEKYQSIDGFGFTLTGGSAEMINSLNDSKRAELLQKLFGNVENAISINFLRLSIGASDLDGSTFSYNDIPEGQTDPNLEQFSIEKDEENLIPLLKNILAINPDIKILGSPWSPPTWMKDNKDTKGGSLLPEYYDVYAQYLVKYIQAMQEEGISIYGITPQNEPLHPENNPSMFMPATAQAEFIKKSLGPAFETSNIDTKIVIYDHNADKPEYPLTILNDAEARPYIAGSAFHLYAGDISALSTVHNQFPDKEIYFTEQYTASSGEFAGDLKWHLKNVIIGSMRNWSRTALEWNLANDANYGPHTDGGCTTCKGAITVTSSSSYTENVGFYIIGHASKFVPAGSERIKSNISGNLNNVAFRTPSGEKVLIVENDGGNTELFNAKYNGEWFTASLEGGAVGTFIWD